MALSLAAAGALGGALYGVEHRGMGKLHSAGATCLLPHGSHAQLLLHSSDIVACKVYIWRRRCRKSVLL